jgi:mannose/fructose/N-acetylgalactosamine-specific phosphotransferase system component IIC
VLLTGRSGDGGGSSDNTGLIIGVAVAVPLAVLLVLVVIVSAVVITYWRKRSQSSIAAHNSVNFTADDSVL